MVRGLTRTQLQTQRNWTKTMVNKFLTIPATGKTKKLYSSEYVDTYNVDAIIEIERSPLFQEYVKKNANKRSSSIKAGRKKVTANIAAKKKK